MAKYTNVIRFRVKSVKQQEFESAFSKAEMWDGQSLHIVAKTGQQTYAAYGFWEREKKMADARPQMVGLLDSTRHLLDELFPELGVTDPVSGNVVFENHIN